MIQLLVTAWQTAGETVAYLLAYNLVLLLAPALHLALVAAGRWGPVARARRRGDVGGAVVAGLTSPLSHRAWRDDLLRLADRPGAAMTFLAVSHGLNAYALVLLGPLLGKDFLLAYVVGFALFAIFGTALAHLLMAWRARPTDLERLPSEAPEPLPRVLLAVAGRFVLLATLGLALGSLVGAWGLSPRAVVPAALAAAGLPTQASSSLLGLLLAVTGVPPVANLFVGTYLWKVGLAHAGIVAFFCAATAAPTRWSLYSRLYGRPAGIRLVGALLAAALLAGLVTAWAFGALGVPIRYKLISEQLWLL